MNHSSPPRACSLFRACAPNPRWNSSSAPAEPSVRLSNGGAVFAHGFDGCLTWFADWQNGRVGSRLPVRAGRHAVKPMKLNDDDDSRLRDTDNKCMTASTCPRNLFIMTAGRSSCLRKLLPLFSTGSIARPSVRSPARAPALPLNSWAAERMHAFASIRFSFGRRGPARGTSHELSRLDWASLGAIQWQLLESSARPSLIHKS